MLKSANLTLDDITMVAAADDTVPLLLQNKVDAITGITNAEGTEMVTAGKQTPEFMPAIEHGVPNTPIFMLAANDDWLAKNPELAKAFLRATHKSIEYAIAHPDEGIAAFERLFQGLRCDLRHPAVEGHDPAVRRGRPISWCSTTPIGRHCWSGQEPWSR